MHHMRQSQMQITEVDAVYRFSLHNRNVLNVNVLNVTALRATAIGKEEKSENWFYSDFMVLDAWCGKDMEFILAFSLGLVKEIYLSISSGE